MNRAPDCSGNPLCEQRLERKAGDVRPNLWKTILKTVGGKHIE